MKACKLTIESLKKLKCNLCIIMNVENKDIVANWNKNVG